MAEAKKSDLRRWADAKNEERLDSFRPPPQEPREQPTLEDEGYMVVLPDAALFNAKKVAALAGRMPVGELTARLKGAPVCWRTFGDAQWITGQDLVDLCDAGLLGSVAKGLIQIVTVNDIGDLWRPESARFGAGEVLNPFTRQVVYTGLADARVDALPDVVCRAMSDAMIAKPCPAARQSQWVLVSVLGSEGKTWRVAETLAEALPVEAGIIFAGDSERFLWIRSLRPDHLALASAPVETAAKPLFTQSDR